MSIMYIYIYACTYVYVHQHPNEPLFAAVEFSAFIGTVYQPAPNQVSPTLAPPYLATYRRQAHHFLRTNDPIHLILLVI